MGTSPVNVQAIGDPAVTVPTTIQTPKAIIPADIKGGNKPNASAAISESPRSSVGLADGSRIEPIATVAMPRRFDIGAERSNKTTIQYAPRFDTSRENIERYQ
jgi:hypothetical protein